MATAKNQAEAIRLSMMIQGVGVGRDVPDQDVVDSFEKMEGKTSAFGKWASSAVSFFLPRVAPATGRAKTATQAASAEADFPIARPAV